MGGTKAYENLLEEARLMGRGLAWRARRGFYRGGGANEGGLQEWAEPVT